MTSNKGTLDDTVVTSSPEERVSLTARALEQACEREVLDIARRVGLGEITPDEAKVEVADLRKRRDKASAEIYAGDLLKSV